MKILILDDYDDNLVLLRGMLESQNFEVKEASNGLEGLSIAQKWLPNMIISDILMPQMDGFTFCRVIKGMEEFKYTPFIFYTATYLDKADEKLGLALGAVCYIHKPIDPVVFLRQIDEVIEQGETKILQNGDYFSGNEVALNVLHQERIAQKLDKKLRELNRLREEEDLILDAISEGIIGFDSSGKQIVVNRAASKMLGYTIDEMIGNTSHEFWHPAKIDGLRFSEENCPLCKSIKYREPFTHYEGSFYRKNGSDFLVEYSSTPFAGSNAQQVTVMVFKDVTAQKEIENLIKKQHTYLQAIIDGVNEPIMVIKEDYTIELMNSSLKDSLDPSQIADLEYPKCYEVSHNRSIPCDGFDHQCPLKNVLETKENTTVVHNHPNKDGEKRYIELAATPLLDEDKNCIGIIESARDITGHIEAKNELTEQRSILDYQAHHDALTGLPNRVLFNDRLEQAIEVAKRNETKVALLFIDLDHFKEINDSLGHVVGDEILKVITLRLEEVVRKEDTVARLGGDEFTVILEELIHAEDASLIANKILTDFAKVIQIEGHNLYVSCSIGISIYPDDGKSAQNLLKFADSAMYRAKEEGRNNFQYYSAEMTHIAFERVFMESSLRSGLEHEEFIVHYQVQVQAKTDNLVGMEALVRWQHPTMGLMSPDKFIPLAESTGLIVALDRYVMKTAMKQFAQWYESGLNPGILAMNLTVKQLQQKDFIQIFQELMNKTGCKPQWLELELTESQIMMNPDQAIETLKEINNLQVGLAVDDFGTGYSSLSYLKKLPIHKLKIDQAFIKGLPEDEDDSSITRAIIALAKNLNLKTIAEGVETKEQKDFLIENGCENIQGYLYSKPIPAEQMTILIQSKVVNI